MLSLVPRLYHLLWCPMLSPSQPTKTQREPFQASIFEDVNHCWKFINLYWADQGSIILILIQNLAQKRLSELLIIQTISTGKPVEISKLTLKLWFGNWNVKYSWFWPWNVKSDPKFGWDFYSGLKFLLFNSLILEN